ncbi:MAG: nuclear transport factor 2 family protein [Gammaproteobacteria bacterium]
MTPLSSKSSRPAVSGRVLRSAGCWAGLATLAVLAAQALDAQQLRPASDPPSLAGLQARITYLTDRQEIADTLQRYIRGIDRHDKDLARSAFWPDARINLGTPLGRDEYVDHEEAALAAYASHQHHITGQTVDLQGNTAHVESYVFFFALPRDRRPDGVGRATPGHALTSEKTRVGSGRYIERWEKRNGEWKILVREYAHDLSVDADTVDYCGTRPCIGRWDREDLSYVRPLQPQTAEQRKARAEGTRKTNSPAAP